MGGADSLDEFSPPRCLAAAPLTADGVVSDWVLLPFVINFGVDKFVFVVFVPVVVVVAGLVFVWAATSAGAKR